MAAPSSSSLPPAELTGSQEGVQATLPSLKSPPLALRLPFPTGGSRVLCSQEVGWQVQGVACVCCGGVRSTGLALPLLLNESCSPHAGRQVLLAVATPRAR